MFKKLPDNQIVFPSYGDQLGFMMAFELSKTVDARRIVEQIPESVVVCTPKIIAGPEHVAAVLSQVKESSRRGISLARNRSIDMLMRITCRKQISEAIALSEVEKTDRLAIFGLVTKQSIVNDVQRILSNEAGEIGRADDLLLLTRDKAGYLKKLHGLSESLTDNQLLVALKEKSALLILDR